MEAISADEKIVKTASRPKTASRTPTQRLKILDTATSKRYVSSQVNRSPSCFVVLKNRSAARAVLGNVMALDIGELAQDLRLPTEDVARTVQLLDEGNTVPFITRFRKDQTGGLDEQQIRRIQQTIERRRMLAERKRTILRSMESQGTLTDELRGAVESAKSPRRLEDLYLPFKVKKQSLATQARDRGLAPLAEELIQALPQANDLEQRATEFIVPLKDLSNLADVMHGAGHLVVERFAENAELRGRLRRELWKTAKIVCERITPEPPPELTAEAPPEDAKLNAGEAQKEKTPADSAAGAEQQPATTPQPSAEKHATADPPAETASAETASAETTPAETTPVETSEAVSEKATDAENATEDQKPGFLEKPGFDNNEIQDAEQSAEPADKASAPTEPAAAEPAAAEPDSTESAAAPASKAPPEAPAKKAKAAARRKKKKKGKSKKEKSDQAFKDYFAFEEKITGLPPHRILAINRGERARAIRVKLKYDFDALLADAEEMLIAPEHPHADFLKTCVRDAVSRFILPSLEREIRRELTEKAELQAVEVFAQNLRKLLLQPPVKERVILAIDPGFRSGCPVAVVGPFGEILALDRIHVVGSESRRKASRAKIASLVGEHGVAAIAIGNGAASRAAEHLVSDLLADELKQSDASYVFVNEAGTSVYAASPQGREELPKLDAAQRSAVSLARRLLDPLSELVKVSPANIGVGMYQHDIKAKHLRESLDAVVESCVNYVGVDVNTASPALLRYVSGLNQLTARHVYEHRQTHGPFKNREQLLEVAGFGDAAFLQSAGFLKISGGEQPLDATWIHPESYPAARTVLDKMGLTEQELVSLLPRSPSPPQVTPPQEPAVQEPAVQEPEAQPSESTSGAATSGAEVAAQIPETPAGESPPADEATPPAETPSVETPSVETPPVDESPAPLETQESPLADESSAVGEAGEEPTSDETSSSEPTNSGEIKPESLASISAAPGVAESDNSEASRAAAGVSIMRRLSELDVVAAAKEMGVSERSLRELLKALAKPGRDPRDELPPPMFRRGIMKIEDLKPGMQLAGVVLNVVDFGVFVDVGVSDSGLVHISRLANRYVSDPHEVVSVGQHLATWVVDVDLKRRRVSLTAIDPAAEKKPAPRRSHKQSDRQPAKPKPSKRRDQRHARSSAAGSRPAKKSRTFGSRKKAVKAPPITEQMKEGKAPMRTFGDLQQFFKTQDPPDANADNKN